MHTFIHTYTHMYTHTYMHMHTYTHTHILLTYHVLLFIRMVLGSQVSVPILNAPGDRFLINGGRIVIVFTRVEDTGVYTCTASNPVGQASASFRISVFSLSNLVQAQVNSFSNGVAMASTVCHNTNQKEFEVRSLNSLFVGLF